MNEKEIRLTLVEKIEKELDEKLSQGVEPHFAHPNQTNPILRKMVEFNNQKSEKFSIKDLLKW